MATTKQGTNGPGSDSRTSGPRAETTAETVRREVAERVEHGDTDDRPESGRDQLARQSQAQAEVKAEQNEFRHTFVVTIDRGNEWEKIEFDHEPNKIGLLQLALQAGYHPKGLAELVNERVHDDKRTVELTYAAPAVHASVDPDPAETVTPTRALQMQERRAKKQQRRTD